MREFLRQCRRYFLYAAMFSLFVNLLMLTLPLYMMQVFDRVISSGSTETLVMLTMAALGAFLIHMAMDGLRTRLLLGAGVALDGLAGPTVVNGLLATGAQPGAANAFTASLRDVAVIRGFLTGVGIVSLFDSPWVPIYLAIIFIFHPLLGIIATLGAAALFAMGYANEKLTREPLDQMSGATRRASRYIDAGLRNAEVANALGMVDDVVRRWGSMNDKVIEYMVIADGRASWIRGVSRFMRLSLQILMLGIGAYLVIQQHVSSGIMMAGTLILSRALSPVESAIHSWKGFVDAREAYARLNEMLAGAPKSQQRTELPAPKGRLEVERVNFAFPKQDRMVLMGMTFVLEPGESMGLIGPSAAGKSTLARLLTGIWRPLSGVVRLDGADVSTWPRDQLGPYIGYVPQDVELFSGTVGENIARLRKDARSEDIIKAAQRAHAHEMIARLPNAYDTEVGEGGGILSAGQRQRVALARALFGDPRVVILDEPNANLDGEGEEALGQTLKELKRDGVTTITISHRPSLLSHVDKLLVVKDGKPEMFGPRADVVSRLTIKGGAPGPDLTPVPIAGRKP